MKLNLHRGDVESAVNWVRSKPPDYVGDWTELPPRPTLFNHVGFFDHEIYPESEADMAGYWLEDRILGGVPAFNRMSEETGTVPNVYFHSCHKRVTRRIFQLRDEQQQELTDFLLKDTSTLPSGHCPLPILADDSNHVRIDVHKAIIHHRVYRDAWERRPWTGDQVLRFERRPKEEIDYPGMQAFANYLNSLPLTAKKVDFADLGNRDGTSNDEPSLPTARQKAERENHYDEENGKHDVVTD